MFLQNPIAQQGSCSNQSMGKQTILKYQEFMLTPRCPPAARERAHLCRFLTKVPLRVSSCNSVGHGMVVPRNCCLCLYTEHGIFLVLRDLHYCYSFLPWFGKHNTEYFEQVSWADRAGMWRLLRTVQSLWCIQWRCVFYMTVSLENRQDSLLTQRGNMTSMHTSSSSARSNWGRCQLLDSHHTVCEPVHHSLFICLTAAPGEF